MRLIYGMRCVGVRCKKKKKNLSENLDYAAGSNFPSTLSNDF